MAVKFAILEKDGVDYDIPVEYTLQPGDVPSVFSIQYVNSPVIVPLYSQMLLWNYLEINDSLEINGAVVVFD